MAVYVVANYRITDEAGIAEYREKVIPQLMKAGCEFLVLNDNVEGAEGTLAPSLVVLKFETMEALNTWYTSPEYQAIKPLRINATTDSWVAVSEEFQMPG